MENILKVETVRRNGAELVGARFAVYEVIGKDGEGTLNLFLSFERRARFLSLSLSLSLFPLA